MYKETGYKQWTSLADTDLVSCVNWNKKFTALTETGEIFQEVEDKATTTEEFEIETGWLAFDRAFIRFQRLREVTLLAKFDGLQSLIFSFDFNYKNGFQAEEFTVDLDQFSDSPAIAGGAVQTGPQLSCLLYTSPSPRD